jgi:hypothetical protein
MVVNEWLSTKESEIQSNASGILLLWDEARSLSTSISTLNMTKAPMTHYHDADAFLGAWPVERGGTGATDKEEARSNLGIPKMEYGIAQGTIPGNADYVLIPIKFNKAFTTTPTISLTVNSGVGGAGKEWRVGATNVTVYGFSISLGGNANAGTNVHWVAIGE